MLATNRPLSREQARSHGSSRKTAHGFAAVDFDGENFAKFCAGSAFDRRAPGRDDLRMSRARPRADNLPRLWAHRALGEELQRVLRECLALAVAAVPGDVHRARLSLKRARAVLRLAEGCGLGSATTLRHQLARHARQLAAVRDQSVVTELARECATEFRGDARRCALAVAASATLEHEVIRWASWIKWLSEQTDRLARQPWPVVSRQQLRRTLAKSVRRTRKTHIARTGEASAEELHEWRKAVIVLREQLHVLRPLLSRPQRGLPRRLHELSRRLGAVGDWRMVINAMVGTHAHVEVSTGRGHLIAHAQDRRHQAIKQACRQWVALKPALRRRLI